MFELLFWPLDLELVPFLRKVQLDMGNTNALGSGCPECDVYLLNILYVLMHIILHMYILNVDSAKEYI